MKFEIAQKGLNYIYHLIKDRQERKLTISFYGGEATLNFKVVQKIVESAHQLFKGCELSFSITTNSTCLNKKMIDFFVKNDFTISFSLDGPLNSHDAKRQYPDGKGSFSDNMKIEYHKKDISQCLSLSKIDGNFSRINEIQYYQQKRYNSCWRFKLAITEKFEVKPCIFSEMVVGRLGKESIRNIITKMEKYWDLSKDKIEICQDCELRYICFDCREIAYRESGSLCGPNLNCSYNPYTGKWGKSRVKGKGGN